MTADPMVDAVCDWCGKPCQTQLNPENTNAYCGTYCRTEAYRYRRDMRRLGCNGNPPESGSTLHQYDGSND